MTRRNYPRASSRSYQGTCAVCGDRFLTGYPYTLYCGPECRQEAAAERLRGRQPLPPARASRPAPEPIRQPSHRTATVPDSPAERARRYRLRKAGQLPPAESLICSACSKPHRGKHGQLCRDCWRSLTPEGKADRAERVRRARAKRKRNEM